MLEVRLALGREERDLRASPVCQARRGVAHLPQNQPLACPGEASDHVRVGAWPLQLCDLRRPRGPEPVSSPIQGVHGTAARPQAGCLERRKWPLPSWSTCPVPGAMPGV